MYVTPEYITLDTEFLPNVQKNVGKFKTIIMIITRFAKNLKYWNRDGMLETVL